ncbi:pyrroloquinoline quinone biosynthesis protein PqqB [Burkholderia vietnamiensis]|jgi:pyrroloquinoline quinone biosynthesis protein B|uniref:Coenzyme PQQ synthesis protein B n=2 Tax=Burkholderia vietnamiensis TaxID=60552 RepID=A4JT49_BURVG|nr:MULTISPECIES: pyrroloquinoline quinone biosynthesis protein PqqB [Burkholderia]ABO59452.1 coenzyme PQQ biosynthesis protein B [Burkholderia vietnamiensis G4]TPQ45244.1 pyrroloquinoline quinone biosynthesis protein PqqB [Burkholderia ubonensis]AFJ90286.1 Coenzyme PQQ synthesis protein B PqqB [Burkholderia sp. KJ006]AJY08252.1 coenzyme PQQ biosynthesis protein B [Burkholderia vietnamiensis LMG 10929]AOJ17599.1 pyrroloquinoline quinone biosynthesis protein B [Burkholderia vietnamiensis]
MKIKILGSGAGGGLPQWNCNCSNCRRARTGSSGIVPRTQSSIAVSGNGVDWVLVNASPDILTQLRADPDLQPARQIRDSAIAAVMLCDAQIDHVTGLLMLRERTSPLPLYASAPVLEDLSTGLPLVPLLGHYCGVDVNPIALREPFAIAGAPGLRFTALPVDSKPPPYSPHRAASVPGDNIALLIQDTATGRQAFYAPGLADVDDGVRAAMRDAELVLVDGTFWTGTEMIDLGLSSKHAADMGHLAQRGDAAHPGMIERLGVLPASTRKVLTHINNTNPILDPGSPERAQLREHGIEVAHDGMQFEV